MLDRRDIVYAMGALAAMAALSLWWMNKLEKAKDEGYRLASAQWEARYSAAMADASRKAFVQAQQIRIIEAESAAKVFALQEKHRDELERLGATHRGAVSELDALRVLLKKRAATCSPSAMPDASGDSAAASEGHASATDPIGDVLGECAARLVAVAKDADQLHAQVTALQGYAKAVTAMNPPTN